MSLERAWCAGLAVAGLGTAVAFDGRPTLVLAGAVVAAAATGTAVEVRVPALVGAGRRHASTAGFVSVVALYTFAVGALWWVELDSDDDHALVAASSTAHGYLLAAAVVATVGAGFAIGRGRAVPVLMAIAVVLALGLSAHQDPWDFDRTVGVGFALVPVPSLIFLGVGARQLTEDGRRPRSGRVLSGAIALLVVLAAAVLVG